MTNDLRLFLKRGEHNKTTMFNYEGKVSSRICIFGP